jgi:acetate kinase
VRILRILLLNAGSSSLKFELIEMTNENILIKGACEKIGSEKSFVKWKACEKNNARGITKGKEEILLKSHREAFYFVKDLVFNKALGGLKNLGDISAIGHRVVHGGKYFKTAQPIDDEVIAKIQKLTKLAPLHNQASLDVIFLCREFFGDGIPQVAVFDTSFYFNMSPKSYMYGLPYKYYEKYGIRKYGFHGTSHKFVSQECAKMMNKSLQELKIVSCHLGNGSSITAIDKGKAIDTSMGFTPLDGIIMGTRCGSLDSSVVTFIEEKENLIPKKTNEILNKESGLLGISGVSNDDREIIKAIEKGNTRAILAHEMMDYQIIKYIGAYSAAMNGLDALIFTAGIGENQWVHRETVCESLSFMGLKIDKKINKEKILGETGEISTKDSKIRVYVIATNEELMIARETVERLGIKE